MLYGLSDLCTSDISNCCSDYGLATYIDIVKNILNVIHIVVPIILIVMATIELSKMVANPDDKGDKLKKSLLNKFIATVIVFFVPYTVNLVIKFVVPDNFELHKCWDAASQSVTIMDENKAYYDKIYNNVKVYDRSKTTKNNKVVRTLVAHAAGSIKGNSTSGEKIRNGKKYKLSNSDLRYLAAVCMREQGSSTDGVRAEANLIANLYELNGKKYSSITSYVKNSGWFGSSGVKPTNNKNAINVVKSVLVDGNRTLPFYINEHDCWFCHHYKDKHQYCKNGNLGDICTVGGHSQKSYITNRSNYKKDKTVITNCYGSVYTFYFFATSTSDPFGYTAAAYNKVKSMNK